MCHKRKKQGFKCSLQHVGQNFSRLMYICASLQVASFRRKFNEFAAPSCYLLSIVRRARVSRYHIVHRGKGNKGTFNESGYICTEESILSWCISRNSLKSFYTFLITTACVRATSACDVKKGTKLLENAIQRALARCSGTRCEKKGGKRRQGSVYIV